MLVQPLGDKQSQFNEYIQGCIDKYEPMQKHDRCIENEKDRVEMSLRQPQSMVVSRYFGIGLRCCSLSASSLDL